VWETRCRNIIARDIIVDRPKDPNLIVSRNFDAFYETLQLQFKKPDCTRISQNVPLYVRLYSPRYIIGKVSLHCCIIKGPELFVNIPPFQFECHLTSKRPESDWLLYPMSSDLVNKFINTTQPINLRIMLFDKRLGKISSDFRALENDSDGSNSSAAMGIADDEDDSDDDNDNDNDDDDSSGSD